MQMELSTLFVAPCMLLQSRFASGSPLRCVSTARPGRSRRMRHVIHCTVAEGGTMADALDYVPSALKGSLLQLPDDAEVAKLGERHTKIVATIGPSTGTFNDILRLAAGGMNMVRLNMSHGDFDWHREVIESVRQINLTSPFVIGIMLDLGSLDSVRLGEFSRAPTLAKGDDFILTSRHTAEYPPNTSEVSSDEFLSVAVVGDLLQCQAESGGVVQLRVKAIKDNDAICEVMSPGTLHSRGSITIRGKSFSTVSSADEDLNTTLARSVLGCPPDQLEFAVSQRVEYISLAFVESAAQVEAVKRLLQTRRANIGVISKIESPAGLENLEEIVEASDAVMVGRGDLGASINYERVPYWQEKAVRACRKYGKPSMVSTHFLESMVLYPTPTRAEVTDMTEAVKQGTDVLVLTSETASGRHPFKALSTMHAVLRRVQKRMHEESYQSAFKRIPTLTTDPSWWTKKVGDIAETIASNAALLASQRSARAVLVFTQKGLMATLMSRYRPYAPIYAFTATPTVRNKMNLLYGVRPFRIVFEDDPEETIQNAINTLKERNAVSDGDTVVLLADVLGGREGSTEQETREVFDEFARGSRYISATEVRNALRRLELKVSDKIEAQLGMRKVDVEDAKFEMELKNEQSIAPLTASATQPSNEKFDYARFRDFVSQAKEIVHTVQVRYVK